MLILYWIIAGLVAGALARRIAPGTSQQGWLADLALGLIGAVIGGGLFWLERGHYAHGVVISAIVAFVVAALLLTITRVINRRRTA